MLKSLENSIITVIKLLFELQISLIELILTWQIEKSRRWINRRWLVRPMNTTRQDTGFFNTVFQEMKLDDEMFFRYTRMDVATYEYLLKKVEPLLNKRPTRDDVISAEQRFAITLRYLATGDEVFSIATHYQVGESTVYGIIKEVCQVLGSVLSPIYLKTPCKAAWRNICKGFYNDWNFPNCCGAIDGKHVQIRCPVNSGSLFFNYKKTNSIVLLAACNHRYEFTLCTIGAYGGESDGGIFLRSGFAETIEKELNLDNEITLPGSVIKTPMCFVTDEAFKIGYHVMRLYPGRHLPAKQRIFNYRLSRARRCIENAFGILVSRWRIFTKPIGFQPEDVDKIVVACVCLHNFLMSKTQKYVRNKYCPPDYVDSYGPDGSLREGQWRQNIPSTVVADANSMNSSTDSNKAAYEIREKFAEYFLTPEGEVPWQYEFIERGKYRDS